MRKDKIMFCMETTNCSCGCNKRKCDFNPCAVTCSNCVEQYCDYAYIYNITEQIVGTNEAVEFSSNGALSGSITHIAGSSDIVVTRTGVYLINFYISSTSEYNKVTLYRNSEAVAGSTYDAAEGNNYGQIIVALQAGDVINLENTDAGNITLAAVTSGNESTVNASMTFVRVF